VKKLVANANATSGKFPPPTLKTHRKLLYSREAGLPINMFTRRNANVVVGLPIVMYCRGKQSFITVHLVEGGLFDLLKIDDPWFMKEVGKVEGLGVQALAED